jgi:hypothetical protein
LEAVLVAKTPVLQRFSDAFPEKINREIIFDNREVCCTEQGNLHLFEQWRQRVDVTRLATLSAALAMKPRFGLRSFGSDCDSQPGEFRSRFCDHFVQGDLRAVEM